MTGKRQIRIGVDFHTFDGIFQGSRSHVLGLFAAAVRMAPDYCFVMFLERPQLLREQHPVFGSANVELVRMPHAPGMARLALQLPWLRRRHRVDLLHMQYRIPPLLGGACAATIHDVLFESHPQYFGKAFVQQSKITFRQAARQAEVLYSVSEFSRQEIASRYQVDAERIRILYNAVDRQRFFPGADGAERLAAYGLLPGQYLLTVGRLEPRKNHAHLLRAYAALPADTPPLVIVGQKDFGWEGLFSLVEQLKLGQRVQFLHKVGDNDLPALLRHALLFVFPAFAEGFGMPVLEAMASGVPVVTSNTTSLPEIAGDAALFADPQRPEDIAAAIGQALQSPGLRQDMVARGLLRAQGFDWDRSAQTLLAGYEQYFAGKRGG